MGELEIQYGEELRRSNQVPDLFLAELEQAVIRQTEVIHKRIHEGR